MTFRYHLRAEQDVERAAAETAQDFLMRELAARRVAIHALDARLGHEDAELLFELFRARAEIFDIAAAAFRAESGSVGHKAAARAGGCRSDGREAACRRASSHGRRAACRSRDNG